MTSVSGPDAARLARGNAGLLKGLRRRRHRLAGLLAVLLLGLLVVPALAADPVASPDPAEPPVPVVEGIAFDGSLTVTFAEPDAAGGGPIGAADVVVTASRDGLDIEALYGQTDAAGTVHVADVPRATDGGTPVLLAVSASRYDVPADGTCEQVTGWAATKGGVVSDIDVVVALVASAATAESCSSGTGTGVDIPGVLLDGSLLVTVVDGSGAPLGGVDVGVFALIGTDGQGYVTPDVVTDDAGQASFTDLPRPDADGPSITWQVTAGVTEETEVDGCTFAASSTGGLAITASGEPLTAELVLTQGDVQPTGCSDPPDGSPVLTGVLSGPDGAPVPGFVRITEVRADGGTWTAQVEAGADGTFQASIHAWGTADAPATLTVDGQGPNTGTRQDGGCVTQLGLVGTASASIALADDPTGPVLSIALAEGVVGVVCDETGAPAAGQTGDDDGLPATDVAAPHFGADGSIKGILIALGALGGAVLATRFGRRAHRAAPGGVPQRPAG